MCFTDDEKRECCLMISIGCDRETACNYLGKTAEQLRAELRDCPEFFKELLRAEATPEFNHMRNLYNAAKEEKNWRASVWWMERRAPERFARRLPDTLSTTQLRNFVEELAETIINEINDSQDRTRLLAKLMDTTKQLQDTDFQADGTLLPAEIENQE